MGIDKTSTLLVKELLSLSQTDEIKEIINKAKQFRYDDFRSKSSTPKTDLFYDLRKAGLTEMAKTVIDGKYD
jgi:hypothetical protein